jgi:biotin carboxylase
MKKLSIIGAGEFQEPLIVKAKEMSLETHVFAWEEGTECESLADFFYPISILEKEKILEICLKIRVNGIASIASDLAVPTVSFIANNMGFKTHNSFIDAEKTTDKYAMRLQFARKGVSTPKFLQTGPEYDPNFTKLDFPLIVKPVDRSGSRGVTKVNDENSLGKAILRACDLSFKKKAIVEEFIDGDEVSVEAISWKGEHFILSITDKVTSGEPYFVEIAHHQPSNLPENIKERIKEETIKALHSLNIKFGASHTEIKVNQKGEVFLIETGARMGGDFIGSDLVRLSTGYDFVRGIIEIALGEFHKPVIKEQNHSGVYFLCKEKEWLNEIIQSNSLPFIVRTAITCENLKNIKSSEDRSGYLIYQSDKREEIKQNIYC